MKTKVDQPTQDSPGVAKKYAPFVVHRRPPGLHWWTDETGKDHGPYVHVKPARGDARHAKREHLRSAETSFAQATKVEEAAA